MKKYYSYEEFNELILNRRVDIDTLEYIYRIEGTDDENELSGESVYFVAHDLDGAKEALKERIKLYGSLDWKKFVLVHSEALPDDFALFLGSYDIIETRTCVNGVWEIEEAKI